MPNKPGNRIKFENADTTVVSTPSEMPTLVIGRLYEVFSKELASGNFDAYETADQAFTWPSKRVGTVVDLAGTRSGLIDSQRKTLAPYVPVVYLVDGTNEYQVDDDDIDAISQTGFELKQTARTDLDRGAQSVWLVSLNGGQVVYKPSGGLTTYSVGDRLGVGAADYTIATVTTTQATLNEDATASLSSSTRVAEDESASDTVAVTPSSTSGRVVVALTGTDFASEVAGISTGDVAVTGIPMTGLSDLQGQLTADLSIVDGLTFGVGVTTADVDDYIVRVVSYDTDATYSTVDQTHYKRIVAVDVDAGTVEVDSDISGGAENDYVKVTIMRAQLGYIESINSTNTEIVVIVPETFSSSKAFVDVYPTATSVNAYPNFTVKVSYRALRTDLVNEASSVSSQSEFLAEVGHDSVSIYDGLGKAMQVTLLAQPTTSPVYYIPVDDEPDGGATGFATDLLTGYVDALETAESIPVKQIVLLDKTDAIYDALRSHITAMCTEDESQYRRGYMFRSVPLGDVESTTGELRPGQVPGGVAAALTSGNKVIRDSSVDFVTDAGVGAGTVVVITAPAAYAGSYTALGTTTDSDLILDGDSWDITREFAVSGTVDLNTTSSGVHVLSGAATGQFLHVEANDYLEVTEGGTRYRLPVTSVNAAGTQVTCGDEVPGDLDFGTGNTGNASSVSVIRSWISPAVEYYIDPLTRSQQAAKLVTQQTDSSEYLSMSLDYSPTIGSDILDPALTLCALAGKRSGSKSFEEVTGLTLGGGITKCKYAYNKFSKSQLKSLSDAGYLLVEQDDASSAPYIRDMITTDTTQVSTQEEMVVSNAIWIGDNLSSAMSTPIGQRRGNIDANLIGLRTIQLDSLLRSWTGSRIIEYNIVSVTQNSANKRQLDIVVDLVLPVAEKEILFTLRRTV